jgi:class 3 adenylate cyclase/ketosteroid isomerase-like protein
VGSVECGACGDSNRAGARFCSGCGAPLARACQGCGRELEPHARFCDECGRATEGAAVDHPVEAHPIETRKVVTVLFADLTGSTSFLEQRDPESARRVMDRYFDGLRTAVEQHGGTVVKFTGDGVMAAFGIPIVQEDDAERAVRAGAAMHSTFDAWRTETGTPPVGLRVGINSGEVVVGADDDVVGDAVNVAARLNESAPNGGVLVGEETWRLVRDRLTLEAVTPILVKGKREPVPGFRLLSLDPPSVPDVMPFVGREPELSRLASTFDDVVAARRPALATIIGSPGLGKTRLVAELTTRLADQAVVLSGRCDAVGGATFGPVADLLRTAAGIDETAEPADVLDALRALVAADERDGARITQKAASLLGVGPPVSPEETFWSVRRIVAVLARERPLVLVIDDVHWAEPMLLDLVEHLAEWTSGVPLLIVAMARPELRDVRPSLTTSGGRAAVVLSLEGLGPAASARLARELLDADDLAGELVERVQTASEGNPLFLGALVRMLVDDGVLRRDDGRWVATVSPEAIDVPPTIHALLSARLERLSADELAVLERASAIGPRFYRGALVELLPDAIAKDVDQLLEGLRRKELVDPEGTYWIDERVYRFHHALIRDAAYRRLLKEARAELHERIADWLEAKVGDLVGEHEESIGYHVEQAYWCWSELDTGRGDLQALGPRAARHLAAAGRRALERDDLSGADGLLGRALACLDADADARPAILLDRCEARLSLGDAAAGAEAVAELDAVVGSSEVMRAWRDCYRTQLATITGAADLSDLGRSVEAAATRLAEVGDLLGAAKAYQVHAAVLGRLGEIGRCEAVLDRAVAAAREAGDRRRANGVLAGKPVAALWGPSPVARASGHCLDVVRVLRITTGSPAVEATAQRCQAVLEAMRGRFDAARRMIGSSRRKLEELGLRHGLYETDLFAGIVEQLAGAHADAETFLTRARTGFASLGADVDAGLAGALLGRTLVDLDRDEEADAVALESERLGRGDVKTAIAWRTARARTAARRGDFDEAVSLARAAVEIVGSSDALLDHADARFTLATVLHEAGRMAEGEREARRAVELYERKGAAVAALKARALAGGDAPGDATGAAARGAVAGAPFTERLVRVMNERDWPAVNALFRDTEWVDHRPLGFGTVPTRHGVAVNAQTNTLAPDFRLTIEEVIAATPQVELVVMRQSGHLATDPDSYWESPHINLYELDPDGRVTHIETFAVENRNDAVARTNELIAATEATFVVPPNLASRAKHRYAAALTSRDLEMLATLLADDVVFDETRRNTGSTAPWRGKADVVGNSEPVRALRSIHFATTVLATRGDRLALGRDAIVMVDGLGGEAVIEAVGVVEVDDESRILNHVAFEVEDVDAAFAELDRRWLEGEGSPYAAMIATTHQALTTTNAGDVEGFAAILADDLVVQDHRTLGWGEVDKETFVETLRYTMEGDVRRNEWLTVDAIGPYGSCSVCRGRGTTDEVEVEFLFRLVTTVDGGLVTRFEMFDIADRDAALARFHELGGRTEERPSLVPPNLASRTTRAYSAALTARDWTSTAAWLADDAFFDDTRRPGGNHHPLEGKAAVLAGLRLLDEVQDFRWVSQRLATRGQYLVLERFDFTIVDALGGRSDVPMLIVTQVDAGGCIVARTSLAADDVDGAYAELDRRWLAAEGAPFAAVVEPRWRAIRAANTIDRDEVAAGHADDLVVVDHRPLGIGRPEKGEYVDFVITGTELAHRQFRVAAIEAVAAHGACELLIGTGVDEHGAEVEWAMYLVSTMADGLVTRTEIFDLADRDAAVARFEELGRTDDGAPPNLAARAFERYNAAISARDWAAAAELVADDVIVDDSRRRGGMYELIRGKEAHLADLRIIEELQEFRWTSELLATRGDQYALTKDQVSFVDGLGGSSDLWMLTLAEVDPEGMIMNRLTFDLERLDEAYDDLDRRWLEGEGAPFADTYRAVTATGNAIRDGDLDAYAAALAPDAVLIDHRPSGFGTLDRQASVELVGPVTGLRYRWNHVVAVDAIEHHGACVVVRAGGGDTTPTDFEWTMRTMTIVERGLVTRTEFFDVDDRDAAVARLQELRPTGGEDALVPENEAYRVARAYFDAYGGRDFDVLAEIVSDDMVFTNRRRLSGGEVHVGKAAVIAALEPLTALRELRIDLTRIATRGERLVLCWADVWFLDALGGEGEQTSLPLLEVDQQGLLLAEVAFDRDDLPAAYEELDRRWLALQPAQRAETLAVGLRAFATIQGDLEAFATTVASDFVLVDHRQLGWDNLTAPEFVEYLRFSLGQPGWVSELLTVDAVAENGYCGAWRAGGPDEEGGTVEVVARGVTIVEAGVVTRYELFDLDARDAAVARLHELGVRPGATSGA